MIVVGICGRLNSGKNVAADLFRDHANFKQIALADPIKEILEKYFRVNQNELWGSSEHRTPRTRQMLQHLGTDFGRHFDPDIWIHHLSSKISTPFAYHRVVVTDVRFRNEADAIKEKYAGYLIKVIRPSISRDTQEDSHESETQVDTIPDSVFHKIVMNDSSLSSFKKRVFRIIKEILNATHQE